MHAIIGRTVKDKITGFTGVAIGHSEFISGLSETLVQPRVSEGAGQPGSWWLEDSRLEILGDTRVVLEQRGEAEG